MPLSPTCPHCPSSLLPPLAAHQPLEMVRRLHLARGLSLVPRDLAGLFAGSNFCPSSFYLPSTRAGLAGWGAQGSTAFPAPVLTPPRQMN